MTTASIQHQFAMALEFHQAGRLAHAEALYHQILGLQPDHAETLHHLGIIAHQAGRHDLAVDLIRQAAVYAPNDSSTHSDLGEACRTAGRFHEASTALHRALELEPNLPQTHNHLGNVLHGQGQLDDAVAEFRRAIELQPNYPAAYSNLGIVLDANGQIDEAIAAFRHALQLQPDYPAACNNLANALKDNGQLDEALAVYRHALELQPDHPRVLSNLIYLLHLHPNQDERMIAEEQRRWNRQFGGGEHRGTGILPVGPVGVPPADPAHSPDRNPERRLRIGYISSDFREHAVGYNLLPLFERHNREHFEIVCYFTAVRADAMTERFRALAGTWRPVPSLSDEQLAKMVSDDGVDILVDLAQHTAGNRLLVFARQPAPVQVSLAGYPESTGLEAIGHRISDRYLEGGSGAAAGQTFLTDSFWCYDPCGAEVHVNDLPASANGHVTFGCLNSFCKINEPVLKLWARVLGEVRDSRLVLLSASGSRQQRTRDFLRQEGVEAHRVEFAAPRARVAYLELYHRLDIVLDTFPYNGHTTSLDALWMGVPVVSLAGKRPVSRAGLSQLSNLGLPELAALSEDDYVAAASQLARDLPRLTKLRTTLRSRLQSSVLMDATRFARGLEAAYRTMWRRWCATTPGVTRSIPPGA